MDTSLQEELIKFWKWFGMTPDEYSKSSANGELESEYVNWNDIYKASEKTIKSLNIKYDAELTECLIQALAIDNECENILEIIKENLIQIPQFSQQVIDSSQHHARWQLAKILGHKDKSVSTSILVKLINEDEDLYVQRRALLSLKIVNLAQARLECIQFTESQDPIFKRIALEIKADKK
jgi:hypothetical protein